METDPRYVLFLERLRSLTTIQLQRILDYPGEMVLDEYNYSPEGNFCPLAVAFDLPKLLVGQELTNDFVRSAVQEAGNRQIPNFKINPLKGRQGVVLLDKST